MKKFVVRLWFDSGCYTDEEFDTEKEALYLATRAMLSNEYILVEILHVHMIHKWERHTWIKTI